MIRYGKLVDDDIEFAPRVIKRENSTIYNPTIRMLIEEGYKPIVNEYPPESSEGYHYEVSYRDDGDTITCIWTQVENEPTPNDLLNILLGEEK